MSATERRSWMARLLWNPRMLELELTPEAERQARELAVRRVRKAIDTIVRAEVELLDPRNGTGRHVDP